ncbi:unnamed protein product [Vicia faba]|uniref:PROP1-like PPR domain-containing protein n=1 Tax=Vicia faba TaxID=3906 RepID=A0AAV0YZ51_VICFA|nr:unnamed protein product [Vicia faba]
MEITSVAFGIPFRHSITDSSSQSTKPFRHSITDSSSQSTKPFSARKSPKLQIQHASDLPSTLTRVGQMLTVKELNTALNHFGNSNKFNNISQLFLWMQENKKMKEDGLVPDLVTYSTLIAGCVKVKDGYPKTLELIQELQDNNLRMDDVIYGAVLAVCASNGKWEEAECYFKQMKSEGRSPNVYHYSSLLNAYSACGNFQKADVLIQDMKSEGLVPNQVILTTLLKVYVRGGLFEKSRELVAELESSGYAEDEMPYCVLMDGLAKAGQIHEAKVIFDKMMKKQVRSDGYAHSIMISAFCRAKLFQEAKQLAKDFQTTFNKYDVVIMNSMLCAFCRVGEMDSVMETLRKMDELAISPDYNTFNILIKYFCSKNMYLLAYRTVEDMHSKGYQPTEELCSSLIFHLGQAKAHSEAFSIYNILKYSKRSICKALHEKILHILLAGKLWKDAYVVFKDNATFISGPTTKKFASAFMKSGNINLINDVMKTLHSCGYKIDPDLFEMAVSRYLGQPEKKDLLLHLLQWMPGQGYVVDPSTRNLILKNSHLFGRQLIAEVLSKQRVKLKAQESR